MTEELYVNKRGFKCVRSQLAKTDGRDPQEHESAKQNNTDTKLLRVRMPEYDDAQ